MSAQAGGDTIQNLKALLGIFSGVPFALLYGALARIVFGASKGNDTLFTTMTIAFLFLVPIAVGALTVFLAPAKYRTSLPHALLMPLLSSLIALVVVTVLAWEALICIVMALPIVVAMATLGGFLVWLAFRLRSQSSNTQILGLILLAPYAFAPVERIIPVVDSVRTVHTQIVINADEATIWQNITHIPTIKDQERSFSVAHDLFGVPKPLEATLTFDGAGGVRRGIYQGGMATVQSILEWQPYRYYRFTVKLDPHSTPPVPYTDIGGPYFDLLEGSYRLEPLGNGQVRLHLYSQHRLSTRFNAYGGWWTDAILADFQSHLLEIIKARSEAQGKPVDYH